MTDFTNDDLIIDTANLKKIPSYPPFEMSENYLSRRFERPVRLAGEMVYEISNDLGYLHQYYRLREEMFIHVWGMSRMSGEPDAHDDRSEIIIARIGNHCIGGCRLTFSDRAGRKHLPMEKDFLLKNALADLPLDHVLYAEISRIAILPEFQNSLVMIELIRHALKRAAERQAGYVFTLAPAATAQHYRKATKLFGLKWKMRYDAFVPEREEYEGVPMIISALDLEPAYQTKTKVAADGDLVAV